MRAWDTLKEGDVLLEKPSFGRRAFVVIQVNKHETLYLNLETGQVCGTPRPYHHDEKNGEPLDVMYKVLERGA